jgi:uncharacterized protein YqeY
MGGVGVKRAIARIHNVPAFHWTAREIGLESVFSGDLESDMGLREQFNEQMKEAMKAKDQRRLSTLRMINAALKDKDIANRTETSREGISDDEILGLLGKMIKQREESAEAFDKGGRPEMAKSEREEVEIIRTFMPKQMSADEQRAAIQGVITDVGATSMKDMGKIMAALKERYAGQMDFGKASGMVKELLK